MASTTTTLKLSKKTKSRLDNLKEYRRETYDEILEKILEILTLSKINPERARSRLMAIDRKKRKSSISQQKRQIRKQSPDEQNLSNSSQIKAQEDQSQINQNLRKIGKNKND